MGVLSAMDLTDGYWIRQHTRSTTAISNLKVCASFTGLSKAWRRPELGLAIPVHTTVFVYMVINFDSLDSASTGDYLLGR